jgi:urea carboxylase
MGLGDVYLGAPVATPLDPRHRLVTTKYNPARTWTPENAVGIGGAYMCIYGMEGPGGYQLFGRTIQMWNTWRTTPEFAPGHPWLLRFFDQIRFFPVSAEELMEARTAFPHGGYPVKIEPGEFSYADYADGLQRDRDSIVAFKQVQQAAFDAERRRWAELRIDEVPDEVAASAAVVDDIPDGHSGVFSEVPGNVWKIFGDVGADVAAGDVIAIIESMKMEIRVLAPVAGRLSSVRVKPGQTLRAGDVVALIKEG